MTYNPLQKLILFCRSIYMTKVMKPLALLFEQPSYYFSLCLSRFIKWNFFVHSTTRNAPYVHPRLDLILKLGRTLPIDLSAFSEGKQHRSMVNEMTKSFQVKLHHNLFALLLRKCSFIFYFCYYISKYHIHHEILSYQSMTSLFHFLSVASVSILGVA